MTPAAWLELIDAYVSERISADAFRRRFLEAWEAARASRAPVPGAIQQLAYVVEAYAGDPTARGHDVADDDDLRAAARQAQGAMAGFAAEARPFPPGADIRASAPPPHFDEAEIRRASVRVGALGGAGCLLALAWLAIVVMQFFAIAAQMQSVTDWGPAPSTLAAVPLAMVPVVGSVTAFFGARDVWEWSPWIAGAVFFALPAISLLGGWQRFGAGLSKRFARRPTP